MADTDDESVLDFLISKRSIEVREYLETLAISAGADSIDDAWRYRVETLVAQLLREGFTARRPTVVSLRQQLDAAYAIRRGLEKQLRRIGKPTPRDLRAVTERVPPDAYPSIRAPSGTRRRVTRPFGAPRSDPSDDPPRDPQPSDEGSETTNGTPDT